MVLTKEEFMQQYVLNRSIIINDGLVGKEEAEEAYNYIKKVVENN